MIKFKSIDLSEHINTCIEFRKDAHLLSFGTSGAPFDESQYIEWLKNSQSKHPYGFFHIHDNNSIIGQIESQLIEKADNSYAYLNLIYIIPSRRNQGLGQQAITYISEIYADKGIKKMRASVSKTNSSSIAFYKNTNWNSIGDNPQDPRLSLLEKVL